MRERQVLGYLAQGLNNAEIATQLGLALRPSEHHVAAVVNKLAAANRADAVVIARAREPLPASLACPWDVPPRSRSRYLDTRRQTIVI